MLRSAKGGSLVGGLSVEEAARFLGIGRSLIFEEIKAGRRTIITYDDAVNYFHSLPVVGAVARCRHPDFKQA
jgi:hypothetical protein